MQWNNDPLGRQRMEDRDKILLMTEIKNIYYLLIYEWLNYGKPQSTKLRNHVTVTKKLQF